MPRLFRHIETQARCRGKLITAHYSYPFGADIHEYRRLDAALRKAFGNNGSRTVGTYLSG